ncbi:ABC transporter ATP-binding protein [Leekyejoonella antrihumi]|uniref:ABC transporter ATP-binding protein n=1 Tax=Leekyejoonella antrihumi TaxID=1660198 RepID=A0A563DZZ4_9MICO|nr:ABC transporter ATP-binding protein [Leekyejoonella antrihumi]TWP35715.1 ABC transporter ATP-binding protein [Leekyejoonella antrihumi]
MSADRQKADHGRPMGAALLVEGLSAGYDTRPVVHEVSIAAEPGEIVSVVGPNGSGKSTLLGALIGTVEVLGGRVALDSQDITGWAPEDVVRAGVGYVPQVDDVFAPLTVRENLEMGGYLLPAREVQPRIDYVASVFPQLAGMLGRRAGRISGGERKMLAMARAMMLQPRLFVLDEPTANLAPAVANELLEEHVRGLAADGATALIVEQRARAVLAISDRTYVLAGGTLRMSGTPAELLSSRQFVASFLGGSASAAESRPDERP